MAVLKIDLSEVVAEYTQGVPRRFWMDEEHLPHGSPIEVIQTAMDDLSQAEAFENNNAPILGQLKRSGELNVFDQLYLEVDLLVEGAMVQHCNGHSIKEYAIDPEHLLLTIHTREPDDAVPPVLPSWG